MLDIYNLDSTENLITLDFYLPKKLLSQWNQYNKDRVSALNIKQEYFSKFFIFNINNNPNRPFIIINLDKAYLDKAMKKLKKMDY